MRTQTNSIVKRGVLIAAGALLTATLLLTTSTAQAGQKQIRDRSSFLSQSAVMMSPPGSPLTTDPYIWVCYNGKDTKKIHYHDFVKDQMKPLSERHYVNGPCPTWTLVCDKGHDQKFIKTSDLANWLQGHPQGTTGVCTGVKPDDKKAICWKGWTIIDENKNLFKYPGYTLGACP